MGAPDLSVAEAALERQYNLPTGILAATRQVESHGNASAISPQGALGAYQLMPATAKSLGVNPLDPSSAVVGAARLWRQNLDASQGDIDQAAMMYHGGPNTANWGPKTHAYPGQILHALQGDHSHAAPQIASQNDPYEGLLAGGKEQSEADPFESLLAHGNGGDVVPARTSAPTANGAGNNGPADGAANGLGMVQRPGTAPPAQNGPTATSSATAPQQGVGGALLSGAAGFVQGLEAPQKTASTLASALLSRMGVGRDAISGAERSVGNALSNVAPGVLQPFMPALFRTKGDDPAAFGAGKFLGEAAITAPLAEISPIAGAGRLARYSNLSLQGAMAGGLTSEGQQVGRNMVAGAALAPAFGIAAEKLVAPALLKAGASSSALGQALARRASGIIPEDAAEAMRSVPSKLADALASRAKAANPQVFDSPPAWSKEGATAGADASDNAAPTFGTETLESMGYRFGKDGLLIDKDGNPAKVNFWRNPATGEELRNTRPDGRVVEADINTQFEPVGDGLMVNDPADSGSPPAPSAKGAAGSRSGIEAVTTLPAPAQADYDRLIAEGVPPNHAINEVAIRHVGAQPTTGTATRDFEAMQAEQELAKEAGTTEGQALRARYANNNAALHASVTDMVSNLGGVPSQGEAAEAVAGSLAKASDAAKAKVDAAYGAARAQDGDAKVNTDALRELMQTPDFRTPSTAEAKQLASSLNEILAGMDRGGSTLRTPQEIETIRQVANGAWNPLGGRVNAMIGKVGGALDESLDQLDDVSEAYRNARAAHRDWASQYADPSGVAALIRRDANGNFVNEDNWRKATDGLIGTSSDKGFVQVAKQLNTLGDTDALNRLKADIIQRAYEAATRGNADSFGNPTFVARRWEDTLNRIGMSKLRAVFSPDEIGHLSLVGHAARAMNEAAPGTLNTSGTSAALVNALRRVKDGPQIGPGAKLLGKTLRGTAHAGAMIAAPGKGNLMVEGVSSMAGKVAKKRVEKAANQALADAILRSLDPKKAREAIEAEAKSKEMSDAFATAMAKRAALPAANSETRQQR